MRIIYDFRIFSQQRHGGISRYFYEIAQRIAAKEGVSARILAPLYVNHYLKHGNSVLAHGIYLAKAPAALAGALDTTNNILSRALLWAKPPDVLHETYYSEHGLARGKTRTVTTVYDMIHEKFAHLYPGDPTPRLKAASVRRADHVFCISRKTQQDLVEILGIDEAKTSVTHLGCDFHLRAKEIGTTAPQPFPYLLFVGPRGAHKNFRLLVAAYSASARLQADLRVVCFGSSPFSGAELEQMRAFGLAPERFLHVTGEDNLLPTYYAHARAFVYPSLYEGFGFPPLEAMSLGCVTACSAAGSIPEVLGTATEYFSPESVEELRQALETVVYSESRRAELVKLGREKAAAYDWEACAAKTLATYKLLGSARSG